MNTLLNKSLKTLAFAFCLLSAVSLNANTADSLKLDVNNIMKLSETEVAELMEMVAEDTSFPADDTITYEFYNSADELVLTKTVHKDEVIDDMQFLNMKRKGDFFMEMGQTSIYILSDQ